MLNLSERLATTITDATGIEPSIVRFAGLEEARPPSVLYRQTDAGGPDFLDPGLSSFHADFEIEARAVTPEAASRLMDDILGELERRWLLARMIDRYDEPDSNSQKRGKYHAHIVEVQLS